MKNIFAHLNIYATNLLIKIFNYNKLFFNVSVVNIYENKISTSIPDYIKKIDNSYFYILRFDFYM